MAKTYVEVLVAAGFVKVPWDKCPQGFEASNYQCYSHAEKNIWAEVYLSCEPVYGHMMAVTFAPRGKFFDSVQELQSLIKTAKGA